MTLLVVDTSVARTAIPAATDKPAQLACARALDQVLAQRTIHAASSNALDAEWLKKRSDGSAYASLFTLRWLATMKSQGRLRHVNDADLALAKAIAAVKQSGSRQELAKDEHVIATALNADLRCLSRDDKMRLIHLPILSPFFPATLDMHWVNPEDPQALPWIQEGLPTTPGLTTAGVKPAGKTAV